MLTWQHALDASERAEVPVGWILQLDWVMRQRCDLSKGCFILPRGCCDGVKCPHSCQGTSFSDKIEQQALSHMGTSEQVCPNTGTYNPFRPILNKGTCPT